MQAAYHSTPVIALVLCELHLQGLVKQLSTAALASVLTECSAAVQVAAHANSLHPSVIAKCVRFQVAAVHRFCFCLQAAILTGRRSKTAVSLSEVDDSVDRIVAGMEGTPMVDSKSKSLVAYHEVGHAVCGTLTPGKHAYLLLLLGSLDIAR